MKELMQQVAVQLGIDEDQAEKAVGTLLSLVQTQGDSGKVAEMFNQMPGSAELAEQYGQESGGGLMGMFGSALGGPIAALSKLQATGLDTDQLKQLGHTVLGHAREQAGDDLVNQVTDSIPGLNKFL